MVPSGIRLWGKDLATKILRLFGRNIVLLRYFEDSGGLYHPGMSFSSRLGYCGAACLLTTTVAVAQRAAEIPAVTAANYAHAEQFLTYNTTPLVLRTGV